MFDGRDLDEAEELVDDWQAGIEARAARARELAARLGALSATARSDDGLVSVTVGPAGDITDLVLTEGVRNRPAATTARVILATLRAARESLTEAAAAATTEIVGADSPTGTAIITSYGCRTAARRGAGHE